MIIGKRIVRNTESQKQCYGFSFERHVIEKLDKDIKTSVILVYNIGLY